MQSIYPKRSSKSGTDIPEEVQPVLPTLSQSSPNQTLFREGSATTSTISTAKEDTEQGGY